MIKYQTEAGTVYATVKKIDGEKVTVATNLKNNYDMSVL